MQEVQTTLPIGSVIRDRYIVEDLLGKGGFGAVYLVRDLRVNQNLFALKEVVDPNKRERARFVFEGELLRRLDHAALPRVYRVFEDDRHDRAYMLMDYVAGPNLEILRQRQPGKRLPLPQVMTIMGPIMQAVDYLHNQHPPIIHRDIKPANIIVPESGDEAVLVDFGIAKEYDPESTTTAIRHASPGYGAPEQYGTGTNTRTDIYGLGATIYALLTGVVPADAFYRTTQLGSKGTDPLVPVNQLAPSVPPHVAAAIHRAMAINSSDRFPTAGEFLQALNDQPIADSAEKTEPLVAPVAVSHPPVAAPATPSHAHASMESIPTVTINKQPEGRRRRRGALLLLLLALLIGLASAAGLLYLVNHQTTRTIIPPPVVHHASPVAHKATPSPTKRAASPTATRPAPTPKVGSTPVAGSYPYVGGSYGGTIVDTNGNISAHMTLSINQSQGQGNINGYFTVNYPLIGSNSFTGSVSTGKAINFTVAGYNGNAPLFFQGTVQSNGNMSGTYCSLDSTGHCNPAVGGYGSWSVFPQTSGSGSGSSLVPSGSVLSLEGVSTLW